MRWSDYFEALPDEDQTRLVNALTLGAGSLRQAVRLIDRDGATGTVLRFLSGASVALLTARRVLGPRAEPGGTDGSSLPEGLAATLPWQAFLATLPAVEAGDLVAWLERAATAGRDGLAAVVADTEVEAITSHLAEATQALAEACRRIMLALER